MFPFEKSVISPGDGKRRPNDFSKCCIILRSEASVSGDTVSYDLDHGTDVVIGHGATIVEQTLDLCLQTMTANELAIVDIPVFDDASRCDSHIRFELKLLSFEPACEVHALKSEELYDRAAQLKDIGTACFKNGNTRVAFLKYGRAQKYLVCFDVESDSSERLKADVEKLRCQLYLNLAACQLQGGNIVAVRDNCSRALSIEPDNVKGRYRRAQSLMKLGSYREAEQDLRHAVKLEPGNKAVTKLLGTVRENLRKEDETLAKAMTKVFS